MMGLHGAHASIAMQAARLGGDPSEVERIGADPPPGRLLLEACSLERRLAG
jgi:hypothetical protein